ncbi:5-demethoxyubiquinol-8 5-hydroxylase UbiM [Inhella gelatinilytica]|uniref:5-demethoxyubiquinol-8 5-hydroxylase UbiM n=1 Tax=Inhella gelatinilytica TaxID=2795030 RepID=A0A931IVD4_9BURK|nr:5-demethoxyubiquinol-8 5-hydroxylase UbiM [Inhella gelatinilytica]MBH9553495.1 5-demethoxyubiquinol-8 5-hydroxylase UbiM [Inhella gelatinilytica]
MSSANLDADVLVVGAGPAGLALSCALVDAGWRVQVFEQAAAERLAEPSDDGREIALTHRSRRILEQLGLWQRFPPPEPLRLATVRSAGTRRVLPFEARSEGREALGWLVGNHHIRAACWAGAQERGIPIHTGVAVTGLDRGAHAARIHLADGRALSAQLVVAADSRFSNLRRLAGIGARSLDFGRSAILCPLGHDIPHGGEAQECFLAGHTLALLPMPGQRVSAVWTVRSDAVAELMGLPEAEFAARVEAACEGRLGPMRVTGQRQVYPLVAVYAHTFAERRFALAGDAAVGMHPVTAHGYNFGLYGVETLVTELARAKHGGADAGDPEALARYARAHRVATQPIFEGTNAIVRLFTDDRMPALWLRRAVLDVAAHFPPVRWAISRQLTGV